MNERIKELSEQAGCSIDGMGYGEGNVEKFAELIVRECCQFEKTYGGDAGLVARSFSRKIREHFGVEEC